MRQGTQISLRRGSRRDSVSEPRMGGEGNMSDQVAGAEEGERLKETTGKREHFGGVAFIG